MFLLVCLLAIVYNPILPMQFLSLRQRQFDLVVVLVHLILDAISKEMIRSNHNV
jgi:hypothetical protein